MRFKGIILLFVAASALTGPQASQAARAAEAEAPAARLSPEKRAELESMHGAAIAKYRAKDLDGAREAWQRILALRPGDKRATMYLEETQGDAEKQAAMRGGDAATVERAAKSRKLLDSPVTVTTDQPIPLDEFMRILSFSTASELEYSIAGGAKAQVSANFVDRPLRDVLDAVVPQAGLAWKMDDSGMLVIRPATSSRSMTLSADSARKARSMLDSGDLARAIGGPGADANGLEITLDNRTRTLTATGTNEQLVKLEGLIAAADKAAPPDLDTTIYKIREDDGPRIKALLGGLLGSQAGSPTAAERKVFVDGTDLIVRDTPENIAKIEELLLDEKFIEQTRGGGLELANFSLIVRDAGGAAGGDQVQVFTTRVVEAVETFLYARTGKQLATQQGRRLWFDPATQQLTVVDTPANVAAVGKFLDSLPELRQKRLQKTLKLEYQTADEMASQLAEILGASSPDSASGAGGADEVVKKLRRGDQFTFRGMRIRLMRVEEGDPNDRNDDECELQINTGTQVSNITLRELDTQFFEDLEITAEDIQPAGGSGGGAGAVSSNRGEGSVRIRLRFVPPAEPQAR